MQTNNRKHREILENIARRVMLERGLLPEFSAAVMAEAGRIQAPAAVDGRLVRDLRELRWASIDNDDSLDLDQLTVAGLLTGNRVKILVAVADVDALVPKGSAMDEHARHNTASVYTAARIFPMLPEVLSTGLTSLNFNEERFSVVVAMEIDPDGSLQGSDVYRARVRNQAKLTYSGVAAWLEGAGPLPAAAAAVTGLAENLLLQDRVARRMKDFRHVRGALSLETVEARPVFVDDAISGLKVERKNRAREMIEEFMIAANGVTARYLSSRGYPSIRRVVRTPKRWDRLVEIAREHNFDLPEIPDSKMLEEFLAKEKAVDPLGFSDLSLSVIKLLGAGEYVAEIPGDDGPGHFGLAVKDYTHSTAPNRRYTDLITQRLLKAAVEGKPSPYELDELGMLAARCTAIEDVVNKVERQAGKSAAALLLKSRIGEWFDAIVTGASAKGTWARLLAVPVEGRVAQGEEGLEVGNRIRVQLISADVERGYIDFKKAGPAGH